MYCMNCGGQVPTGARFCAGCGTVVDAEATRLAPPTRATQPATFLDAPKPASVLERRDARPPTRAGEATATLKDDAEKIIFNARPTILFIGIGYVAAALGAILLVALLTLLPLEISPFVSIPIALALLLIPAYHHLQRNRVQYTLTDSKIVIDRGFVSRTTTNVPLRNIQNVTVTASVMQRLLRFGDVVIDDANAQTGKIILDNIPDPRGHADMLLRELRRWR